MKAHSTLAWIQLLLLLLFAPLSFAENEPLPPAPEFSQQELDQMLAPIALYPDALLSQVLMAATYPLEVVQAARWSKANPGLTGDQAVKAAERNNWDPSVISLTAFPQILDMMDQKLDWTERLGDAFLAQQPQVMDTVQDLRHKASIAGNLQSNDQILVEPQGQTIIIEQASPQVVYVPYYDPTIVYGSWWWDAYPPVYWAPWPGYYARPGYTIGFFWGNGIFVSSGFFFGGCDWHQRRVNIVNVNNYYYSSPHQGSHFANEHTTVVTRNNVTANQPPSAWQHDPQHRHGVPYREQALQQKYGRHLINPTDTRNGSSRPDTTNGEALNRGAPHSQIGQGRNADSGNRPSVRSSETFRASPEIQSNTEDKSADKPGRREGQNRQEIINNPQSRPAQPDSVRPDTRNTQNQNHRERTPRPDSERMQQRNTGVPDMPPAPVIRNETAPASVNRQGPGAGGEARQRPNQNIDRQGGYERDSHREGAPESKAGNAAGTQEHTSRAQRQGGENDSRGN